MRENSEDQGRGSVRQVQTQEELDSLMDHWRQTDTDADRQILRWFAMAQRYFVLSMACLGASLGYYFGRPPGEYAKGNIILYIVVGISTILGISSILFHLIVMRSRFRHLIDETRAGPAKTEWGMWVGTGFFISIISLLIALFATRTIM